jgi:hypothetical protein
MHKLGAKVEGFRRLDEHLEALDEHITAEVALAVAGRRLNTAGHTIVR